MRKSILIALALLLAAVPAQAHQFVTYFDYGRTELSAGGYRMVRELSAYIQRDRPARVIINAHMDSAEAAEFSDELTDRRAQAIATELVTLGIDPAIIERNGHGASSPARPTGIDTPDPLNRRATVDYFPIKSP